MPITNRERQINRVTVAGSIVNCLLLIFKFTAGILGHSAAMIADAVHSLSDFATDIVVFVFVRISGKPEDESHDYGHGKFETLATVLIGAALLFVGGGIFVNGISGIIDNFKGSQPEAPGMIALYAALLSIILKELVYRYTIKVGRAVNSQAVIANAWHHRSDALSSIGTLAGIGGAIFLGEKWRVLDPIAAVVVSIFIIRVSFQLIRPGIDDLLEKSLPKKIEDKIMDVILSVEDVESPHHLRTRRIGNDYAIEVHVRTNGSSTLHEAHRIASEIESKLKMEFGSGTHVIVHMEPHKH